MALSRSEKRIAALAAPALGSLLVEPLYNLTDTAIVGHLGRVPLGGLAVASAILNIVVACCGFLPMATAPRISFLRGRGNTDLATEAAVAAYWAAVATGTALTIAIVLLASPLATLAGARGPTHHAAVVYIRIAAIGMPFLLCMLAGNGHLRGLADTKTPLLIALASNAVNVVAEVVFVYVLGTGISGSAAGTVLAQVVGGVWFVVVSKTRAGRPWWASKPDRSELKRLASQGGVLIIRTLALIIAWSGTTAAASRLGQVRLGGHQIALQVWFLVALSLDALAVPAQVLVSEALGGSGIDEAVRVGRTVLRTGTVVAIGLGALMAATSPFVPEIFTSDGAVRHQATIALLVGAASLPASAVAFELDGVFLGSGDIKYLRRSMFIALFAFSPIIAAVLMDHGLGLVGVWGAVFLWMTVRAVALLLRWRNGRWLPT